MYIMICIYIHVYKLFFLEFFWESVTPRLAASRNNDTKKFLKVSFLRTLLEERTVELAFQNFENGYPPTGSIPK